ncbi:MAG: LysM peptidoglycan-binding domain-containing protein [Bacteroidales bacterium]|nr:LysM peptidoglycan-binding domain-containing protein [Bacteroidales bacterium]
MKIRITLAAVLTVAFMTSVTAAGKDSLATIRQSKARFPSATKSELKTENTRLKTEMDSLRKELARYRKELAVADSINNELMTIYEGNAQETSTGIDPEEYTPEISDSLLNIWYAHRMANDSEDVEDFNMDSVRFESNVPDSVYIKRLEKMNSFITLPYNEIVRNYIILYSEKMPTKMRHILGLCDYYMPKYQEVLNKYDLPEELRAMAIIESALNPTAVSRAGAKGMWQFMYYTAKMYGLNINSFVDERLDPFKSADAAARYLQDAYEIFGDWNLAIASYNCGAGNVNKAIRRSGGSRKFWDIYPFLPRETRGYVPAFVGALYTMKYYKEHGLKPEGVQMPVHVDTFKINKMLHFNQVSELVGIPMEELKNLNPQYVHNIVPGNEREYILVLPYTYTNAFIDKEDSLYTHKASEYFNPATLKKIKDGTDGERIIYKVKNGDYLGRIASRYRCSVAQLKRWNNLRSNNIRVGQRLVIYRGGGPSASSTKASSGSTETTSQTSATGTYVVKKGDTLGKIAERHGCTVTQIKQWNNLSSNNIQINQKLKVSSPAAKPAAQTSSVDKNAEYTIYVVKSGDSLYSIAKQFPKVSAQNIMDFNGIGSSIKPGMKIKIPKL